ncbi:PrgH/EprH family type III secretion apparatus protein [Pantoea sp. SORGH_AS_0659]|uniref:PrgH/EprH family type III secretion apparatus protein n=1 Tax=Pantoea sp. SORGH_AS_0659 TaxID=3062597 RepID=UPI00285FD886|nr:PrgH/EprH family type III secretion apparatus protein [Pantoea sp. SORGH_AS_0659]MDR6352509.1 type III secretion system PrgH/EprH family protein [Pantoea sp. SORGH_AS_0659]
MSSKSLQNENTCRYIIKFINTHLEGCEYPITTNELKCIIGKPDSIFTEQELGEDVLLIPDEKITAEFYLDFINKCIVVHHDNEKEYYKELDFNTVITCGDVFFAVKSITEESWSDEVLGFSFSQPATQAMSEKDADNVNVEPAKSQLSTPFSSSRIVIALFLSLIFLGGGLFIYQLAAERQNAQLLDFIGGNRSDYRIFNGNDNKQYVIARSSHARVWAERSLLASGRFSTVTLLSEPEESEKTASYLGTYFQDIKFHLIRFEDPLNPEIVLSRERNQINEDMKKNVIAALKKRMPWIVSVRFSSLSDNIVENAATTGLKKLGLSYKPHRSNNALTFIFRGEVNDAELNKLKNFIREFDQQWQGHFVRFNIQLENNFLAGKSYQYGPEGYIKINSRHWFFAEPQSKALNLE